MVNDDTDSISGQSASSYLSQDSSVAQLLISHGIEVRDFIIVSFLSDQGPLTIVQLARIVNIAPDELEESMKRLSAAGLLIRELGTSTDDSQTNVRLTTRGQKIASRISEQS